MAPQSSYCQHDTPSQTAIHPKAVKVVSFAPSVRVKKTIHLNNYTDDEIKAAWFQKDEYDLINQEMNTILDMMDRDDVESLSMDEEKYCTYGLEIYTEVGCKVRQQRKVIYHTAVFNAQEKSNIGLNKEKTAPKKKFKKIQRLINYPWFGTSQKMGKSRLARCA